jgi:hypothetical protein
VTGTIEIEVITWITVYAAIAGLFWSLGAGLADFAWSFVHRLLEPKEELYELDESAEPDWGIPAPEGEGLEVPSPTPVDEGEGTQEESPETGEVE